VIFLDINTFFSPKAGGIRTYHRAKIEWFKKHSGIGYFLVYPGPSRKERKEGANVALVEAFGPQLTQDPAGYRLLLDFIHVYRLIRRVRPDVLEAGDPWLTGLFCLALRKLGLFRGLLVSFYHSDPVPTYIEPWAERGIFQGLRGPLAKAAGAVFYWLQRGYDITAVSSKLMEERLRSKGVRALAYLPFGVPAFYLEGAFAAESGNGPGDEPVRLLYAGRLDDDKGVDLILENLPKLLKRNVRVTIIGRGKLAKDFAAFKHPRYQYLGFIEDQSKVRAIYDQHHVLMAPGPHETFGLGVLEAMARGLVVVGPGEGGTSELLRQAKSPFIFTAGSSLDFLEMVLRSLDCDWPVEIARSRSLALKYGGWEDAIGRMVKRYSARLGAKPIHRTSAA
jgi:alpha-1,6-mannosyltransferase